MKQSLSSPWTPFVKVLPLIFLALLPAMVAHGWMTRHEETGLRILLGLILTPLLVVMFFRYRRLLDRVEIHGDRLLLARRGEEYRLPLAEVLNVEQGPLSFPTIVTLRLCSSGPFGEKVRFMTRLTSPSIWSTRLLAVESLITAVHEAKIRPVRA